MSTSPGRCHSMWKGIREIWQARESGLAVRVTFVAAAFFLLGWISNIWIGVGQSALASAAVLLVEGIVTRRRLRLLKKIADTISAVVEGLDGANQNQLENLAKPSPDSDVRPRLIAQQVVAREKLLHLLGLLKGSVPSTAKEIDLDAQGQGGDPR